MMFEVEFAVFVVALALVDFLIASGLLEALLNVFLGPIFPFCRYGRSTAFISTVTII